MHPCDYEDSHDNTTPGEDEDSDDNTTPGEDEDSDDNTTPGEDDDIAYLIECHTKYPLLLQIDFNVLLRFC